MLFSAYLNYTAINKCQNQLGQSNKQKMAMMQKNQNIPKEFLIKLDFLLYASLNDLLFYLQSNNRKLWDIDLEKIEQKNDKLLLTYNST